MPRLTSFASFRWTAFAEAFSLLLLLGLAMPLKYAADMPLAVRIVGSLHGVLFLLYVAHLAVFARAHRLPLWLSAWALLAACLPGGAWLLDHQLRRRLSPASPAGSPERAG